MTCPPASLQVHPVIVMQLQSVHSVGLHMYEVGVPAGPPELCTQYCPSVHRDVPQAKLVPE